ncbi:MAG TPA: CDF family Co(II)/Ni(II) efflux transporter DmeF [Gammaproteobacteria bacterium]|nr:CDF family Co(II)/Ni(II) efflux transporter DmeF [Gammaproteobacteria bacterium]
MHVHRVPEWQHSHSFGQQTRRPGESRTLVVIVLNLLTMIGEIAAGLAFGSMALLADGLHMGSHTAALSLSFAAYVFARRYAGHPRFSFGTGKLNALAGFVGAFLLGLFALAMFGGSLERMLDPVPIEFDAALLVAVIGLAVNAISTFVLGGGFAAASGGAHAGHRHVHDGRHAHEEHHHAQDPLHAHSEDHALRSAYLHVLADALTSVLAIAALLAGKFADLTWLDPLMGMLGAALVVRWAWGLARATAAVLLDQQAEAEVIARVKQAIEGIGDSLVSDLHVWSIGPGIHAAIVSLVTHEPRPLAVYKAAIPGDLRVVHLTVEVDVCPGEGAAPPRYARG